MAVSPGRPDDRFEGSLPQRRVEGPAQQPIEDGPRQREGRERRGQHEHHGHRHDAHQPIEQGDHQIRGQGLQDRVLALEA